MNKYYVEPVQTINTVSPRITHCSESTTSNRVVGEVRYSQYVAMFAVGGTSYQ